MECPHCARFTVRTIGQLNLTPKVRCDSCHKVFDAEMRAVRGEWTDLANDSPRI
jgi:transposase-like protein